MRYLLRASSPSQRTVGLPFLHGTWNQSPRTRQLNKSVNHFVYFNRGLHINILRKWIIPDFHVEGGDILYWQPNPRIDLVQLEFDFIWERCYNLRL